MKIKKFFILIFAFSFTLPALAISDWVSDVKTGNGHVTYTFNLYLPTDNDTLHMKARHDYVCSQQMDAVLWGEGTYLSTGRTVDYTSLMERTKLRKYQPIDRDPNSLEFYQKNIIPYCNH